MAATAPLATEALLLVLYPVALCTVIATDLFQRVIPNLVVAALLGGFLILAALTEVPQIEARLLAAAVLTGAGFALFAQDVIGAGDAKLAGVLALWIDPTLLPAFLLVCGLTGGLLTLAVTLGAARPAPLVPQIARRPAEAAAELARTLPYGVAIAGAGLALHPYSSLMALLSAAS